MWPKLSRYCFMMSGRAVCEGSATLRAAKTRVSSNEGTFEGGLGGWAMVADETVAYRRDLAQECSQRRYIKFMADLEAYVMEPLINWAITNLIPVLTLQMFAVRESFLFLTS